VISPPCKLQKRFNASDVTVENRLSTPVDAEIVGDLTHFASVHRGLLSVGGQIRDIMIPNPD
jgi:hypothetical protein